MERRIIEILVVLMREYPEGVITREEFETLTGDLAELGYSQTEIETALFWYHSRQLVKENSDQKTEFKSGAFRVLHEVERTVLRPEAYGYLIELKQLGLITLTELDAIVEKSVLLGGRQVDLDDIKSFVAAQIMEQDSGFSTPGLSYYLKIPSNRIQ